VNQEGSAAAGSGCTAGGGEEFTPAEAVVFEVWPNAIVRLATKISNAAVARGVCVFMRAAMKRVDAMGFNEQKPTAWKLLFSANRISSSL